MHTGRILAAAFAALFVFSVMGCATSGSSGGGWVVVGKQEPPPPPPPRHKGPSKAERNRGLERAARNHIRSAYRFLEKGKPDHAMRELEKARKKMGKNFWFHYYMGGAYYLKGMFDLANDSWAIAYRYTKDYRLRSRLRTCQSFAVNYTEGDKPSIGFLRTAIDMDGDNRLARELLRDLERSGVAPSGSGTDVQVGFMGPSGNGKGAKDNAKDASKGKKGGKKDDRKGTKSKKKKGKPKKIRDTDRFSEYFLIEMP